MFYQILKDINAGGKGTKAQPGKNAKGSIREKPEFKKIYDIVESVRNKATSKADEHPKLDKCKSLVSGRLALGFGFSREAHWVSLSDSSSNISHKMRKI